MLGVVWALAYELIWRVWPDSFAVSKAANFSRDMEGFEALYYSFSILAPINDNDLVPASNLARMLVMIEATLGVLYMGMLIARLVGIYTREEPSMPPEP
jgi:hypothetical protein